MKDMTVRQYNTMVERHTKQLKAWLATQPPTLWDNHDGNSGRTLDQYLEEYGSKFAIVGYIAQDLECPLADKMLGEYSRVPNELVELMDS